MAQDAGGAQNGAAGDTTQARSEHADKTISAVLGEIVWLMTQSANLQIVTKQLDEFACATLVREGPPPPKSSG